MRTLRSERMIRMAAVLAAVLVLGGASRSARAFFLHPSENVSETPTRSSLSQVTPQAIAVGRGDEVLVVWSELLPGSQRTELFQRLRRPGGWEPARQLTASDSLQSADAAIAADQAGRYYIAWVDEVRGGFDVWAGRVDADAGAIVDAEALTEGERVVMDPAIAVGPDGEIYVAWSSLVGGYEIRFAAWKRGSGWSRPQTLSPADGRASTQPALAVTAAGVLHLVWSDRYQGPGLIRHRALVQGEWSAPVDIAAAEGAAKQLRPVLAIDGNDCLHIAWQETLGSRSRVRTTRWPAGAAAPEVPILIAGDESAARSPAIGADAQGAATLLWEDMRGGSLAERPQQFILCARLENGNLVEQRLVSDPDTGPAFAPAVAVDAAGGVHMVWWDQLVGGGDVLYRRGGLSFVPGVGR